MLATLVASNDAPESVAQKRKKAKKPRGNEPRMELKEELKRICGVDLTSSDGINVMTAFTVISEIGTDIRRFKDKDYLMDGVGPEQGHQQRKGCESGEKN